MDDGSSNDQELLGDTTRSFLEAHASLASTRALADSALGYDRDVWRRGAELGWTSLLVPEAAGGGSVSGDGLADACLVAREFGRLVAPGPLVPTNVVAAALGAVRDGPAHREALGALMDGSATATFTPVGPDGEPSVTLRSAPSGGFVLDGVARPVESASGASWILVAARSEDGPSQVLVALDAPGVTVTPLDGLDLVRRFAEVRFDGVAAAESTLVGARGSAQGALAGQLAIANVLECSETVGALTEIFSRTLAYLADRYSFGRPLNSYQALKHRCADDALAIQRCAATTAAACHAVSSRAADADELVSVAKAFVGPTATELVQDCVQLHGGIGVTWEHDLHLYLRRVTVNRMVDGTPDEHLERVARCTFGEAA